MSRLKGKQRLLIYALVGMLCVPTFTITTNAAQITAESVDYNTEEGTEFTNEYGTGYLFADGTLVVTDFTANSKSVTDVTVYPWYASKDTITSVKFTEDVKFIGAYAFSEYSGLTGSLVIPDSVEYIHNAAFKKCTGFTGTLTLSNSLLEIGNGAFAECMFTGRLKLPAGLTSIGNSAFSRCYGFTGKLTVPSGVTLQKNMSGFGSNFEYMTGINEISTHTTQSRAFEGCHGVEKITLETGCTDIKSKAFNEVNSLKEIYVKDIVTSTYSGTEITVNTPTSVTVYLADGNTFLQSLDWAAANINVVFEDLPLLGQQSTTMTGSVEVDITTLDVTMSLGGLTFAVDAEGNLTSQGAVIKSNTNMPLNIDVVGVKRLKALDTTDGLEATNFDSPMLVPVDTYTAEEWNNLDRINTKKYMAVALKQVDVDGENAGTELTTATTDPNKVTTPVELGNLDANTRLAHLESGYTGETACAINLETDPAYTNYGKTWIGAKDLNMRYLITFEFSWAEE